MPPCFSVKSQTVVPEVIVTTPRPSIEQPPVAKIVTARLEVELAVGVNVSPNTFEAGNVPKLTFFFNDTATTEIYTLSLHDALPISPCFAVKSQTVVPEVIVTTPRPSIEQTPVAKTFAPKPQTELACRVILKPNTLEAGNVPKLTA